MLLAWGRASHQRVATPRALYWPLSRSPWCRGVASPPFVGFAQCHPGHEQLLVALLSGCEAGNSLCHYLGDFTQGIVFWKKGQMSAFLVFLPAFSSVFSASYQSLSPRSHDATEKPRKAFGFSKCWLLCCKKLGPKGKAGVKVFLSTSPSPFPGVGTGRTPALQSVTEYCIDRSTRLASRRSCKLPCGEGSSAHLIYKLRWA